jgi:hypothetical protein
MLSFMEHLCPIFLFSFMTYYRILTRVAWQVPVEEQELFTIPDDLSCSIFRFLCFIDQYLSSYLFFWPLYCLSFFDYTRLPVWYLLAIVLSVLLWLHQITPLVSLNLSSKQDITYCRKIFHAYYCFTFHRICFTLQVKDMPIPTLVI